MKIGEEIEQKEKEKIIQLFNNQLVVILNSFSPKIASMLVDYNTFLIEMIRKNGESFEKELNFSLLNNQEKITESAIDFDGQKKEGTISNWIQYFIKKQGSGIFGSIVLAKFMTNDLNTKKISNEERRLLKKVLQVYKNLKFFPESFANLPAEKWEIIPIEKNLDDAIKPEGLKKPWEIGEKKENNNFKVESNKITLAEKNKNQLDRLYFLLNQYAPGSLEKKALEEEIEKIKKNS